MTEFDRREATDATSAVARQRAVAGGSNPQSPDVGGDQRRWKTWEDYVRHKEDLGCWDEEEELTEEEEEGGQQ